MPGTAQKEARRRKQNRLAQQRRRARLPKPAKDDGQEEFQMPDTPHGVIVPQPVEVCAVCGDPSDANYFGKRYCRKHTPGYRPPEEFKMPEVQRPNPLLFDTGADPRRPDHFPPTVIQLAASPRAAYRLGIQVQAAEAAEAAQEATARANEARAQGRLSNRVGQFFEEEQ